MGQTGQTKQVSAGPVREDIKTPSTSADIKPEQESKKSNIVRHLDKVQDGFKVAETKHFRILHDQASGLVDQIGEAAEKTRTTLQSKWFEEEGTDWDGRCSIYLHSDRAKYAEKTGMKNTLGHMRTLDWGGVYLRTIHLPCKEPNMLADVLPHEVSHSVMAVRFQGRTPRWADEGMAMLAETPESTKECTDRLRRYKKNDGLFAMEILMQTDEPDHFNTMEYYAQSTSLVQFLTAQKGAKAFTQFLRTCAGKDSKDKGPEAALRQHYGIPNFADLEKRWQAFAFGKKAKE